MATNSGKRARREPTEARGVRPLNEIQSVYLNAIRSNVITFGIGPAGVGKTFIAASHAANLLFDKRISRIILTRPNVEAGRGLGFLPGDLTEKYAPYLEPFQQILEHTLGCGFVSYSLKNGSIEPKPLGFLRGVTFQNAVVLIDEAQNATKNEMKLVLSRIGEDCQVIISGDPEQADIPDSGLMDAVYRLHNIRGVSVVEFTDEDIVRSDICREIIKAYRK